MHTLFNTIYKVTSIYMYMDYYIANRWEVAEGAFGISPTCMYSMGQSRQFQTP